MGKNTERMWKDIKLNRPARDDDMVRRGSNRDMTAFRRKPYYLCQQPKAAQQEAAGVSYQYPYAIGDYVFEIYGGRIYPQRVSGFYITASAEYVVCENVEAGETKINIVNVYLSEEEALEAIRKKKGERNNEKGKTGKSLPEDMGRGRPSTKGDCGGTK